MKTLAFIQVASLGAALEAVNVLGNYIDCELVELMPMGGPAVLMLAGDYTNLNIFRRNLRTADLQKSTFIKYQDLVLDIIYHKVNKSLEKNVLILESNFIGDLMAVVETKLDEISVVDFTLNRHHLSQSSLVLSSSDPEPLNEIAEKAHAKKVRATIFDNPSSVLRNLFGEKK